MSNLIIILISIIICIFIIFHYKKKEKSCFQQKFNKLEENYLEKKREELDSQFKEQIEKLNQTYNEYEKNIKERVDNNAKEYEEKAMQLIKFKIQKEQEEQEAQAKFELEKRLAEFDQQYEVAETKLKGLKENVEDFQKKQEAITAEVRRRRELKEKKDFYRVCLRPEAIGDIKILQDARQNLKNPEIIDKIIYDSYVAKPVLEMIKRVLQNTTCSGIYKITCITTGEIYIGKSTDIKNRWQQHCKTAFNCGTIASSLLHTKMKQYGIENFTFEVVEKVPKEQLTEREKFYINFYQTKEVGLNERNG